MAKKGARQLVGLVCNSCKVHNYTTERNRSNSPDKLDLRKFCSNCNRRTSHREKPKLK